MFICVLTSCSTDFLDLAPETALSSSTFFKNKNQFDQALIGAYEQLRPIAVDGIYMDEMRSDNTFFTIFPGDRSRYLNEESIAEFIDDEHSIPTVNRYPDDYIGISRVNTILSRIENIEIENSAKDSIIGEALFLRAFFYYDLVQHYGGVPLQLKELTSDEGAFLPRSSVQEVYGQIIADLLEAIPKLSIASSFPQSGRATQGAAKMLLAYAYMSKSEKEYEKAETALKDITKMNYSLLDNYADNFDPDNKNNKESIFAIQYKQGDEGQQSDFSWRFIPKTTNTEPLTGVIASIGNVNWGGWNVPTQEMIDSYEKGDKRLPASIGVVEGVKDGDNFTIQSVKNVVNYAPTPDKTYYYYVKKYLHPPYEKQYNTDENWPVYRYSDALLLLAECLVKQGKNGEALPYINQVRKRVGLPALAVATEENIATERRHELAFENHRWTDLIRNGNAIKVLKEKGNRMKALYGWLLPAAFSDIDEHRLIYPLPYREMQLNTKLVQNPGY